MRSYIPLFACLLFYKLSHSQQVLPTIERDTSFSNVFHLGEVVVTAEKETQMHSKINSAEIEAFAKTDVSRALNLLPGVTMSNVGPRNEAMIYLRGFDLRQVPLLIDGIPVYVPYDGYADLGRFTTFDLAEINISKGYTSVLYGPNAMGGAINLVTRKPMNAFEMEVTSGWLTGGYRSNINIGSNLGKFYFQGSISRLQRNFFPLSSSFNPIPAEDGGARGNSSHRDDKYAFKLGYTPNNRSEYALSYSYQHGEKGSPVYVGSDTLNNLLRQPRYWQWPYWDKQSLYFISNNIIDETQYIKTRFYYDVFKNQLNSYDDGSYTSITRPYAFESHYNDYTLGGVAEYGKSLWADRDIVKATLQYKRDVHREYNEGEPERTMSDQTLTIGLENIFHMTSALQLLTGFSYNHRGSIEAQDYNSETNEITDFPANRNNAYNIQGGLVYQFNERHITNLSVARKTRFATTKDRYSFRMGTAIPNPDLDAEYTINYELGYNGSFWETLHINTALFYSNIRNTILSMNNVWYDPITEIWLSQLQNAGISKYSGVEIGSSYSVNDWRVGGNYTYIRRKNITNPEVYFVDVPEHNAFGYIQYQTANKYSLQANIEYNSSRYSTSYGTKVGGFTLLHIRAAVPIWQKLSIEGGINNLTDKNYALAEGYPEAGRNYFVNLMFKY
ncbi:TonB-dependent receptor [Olivibacter sp. SDN3]|uniref:TonB-dependent receptor plug domain-containing protein n=1 Tax=Olivibacter sp. SDN3 TaxID=2764720 RepID=UPI001650F8A0|nr:TonB-dependent receptor [Olivibacter sp. SDN3]QNL49052.1 TonB-dependent receptor [Olivibacter sp. SDN3]